MKQAVKRPGDRISIDRMTIALRRVAKSGSPE
jgi:hypothetical protein